MNILVLDDNDIRTAVFGKEAVLKDYGLENVNFRRFACAQRAYKWMEEGNRFDMILLDYTVPHDPNGRPESRVSRRFPDTVFNEYWDKAYQLFVALVTENYKTEEVQNFTADYAWDPNIRVYLFPYDGREGDKWLAELKKATDLLDDVRKGPLAPGRDKLCDWFQSQRIAEEMYEIWDETEERDRIIRRVTELRDHYFPSGEDCGDIPDVEGCSDRDQWLEIMKPCTDRLDEKIKRVIIEETEFFKSGS